MTRKYKIRGKEYTMRQAEIRFGLDHIIVKRIAAHHNITLDEFYAREELWNESVRTIQEDPPYTILGVTYESFEELASACYMTPQELRSKINRVYAGHVVYGVVDMQNAEYIKFQYQDRTYVNAKGIIGYPFLNIIDVVPEGAFEQVYRQVRNGATVEEGIAYWEQYDPTFVCNGTTYPSRRVFLEKLGITSATWNERVEKEGSIEAAEKYYLDKRAAEECAEVYVVNGIECRTTPEVYKALELTIQRTTFADYVRVHGMQAAIAHYTKVGSAGFNASIERYTVGYRTNLGIKEAAELAHTAAQTVRKRSEETGKSIQELLTESYDAWMKDPPPYMVGNTVCKNVTAVAKALGVGLQTVQRRQQSGMTVAEAIEDIQNSQREAEASKADKENAKRLGIGVVMYKAILSELQTPEAVSEYVHKYARFFMTADKGSSWETPRSYECIIDGELHYVPSEIVEKLQTTMSALVSYRGNHPDMTMQQVVDAYVNGNARNGTVVTKGENDIESSRAATATLLFARCAVCGRVLLLKRNDAISYRHSNELCAKLEWESESGR